MTCMERIYDAVERDPGVGGRPIPSEFAQAWRTPRDVEKPIRDTLRGFALLADQNPGLVDSEEFGRYLMAQALAMRAMVQCLPLGRFSKTTLETLVCTLGVEAGIDWVRLDSHDRV